MRLLVYIELYRLLGIEKIFLYNHTTGTDTDKILNYFQDREIVEVISWPSIPASKPEPAYFRKFQAIKKFGQILALNDCILRASGKYRFVTIVDLDELIAPAISSNLTGGLLNLISRKAGIGTGGIKIQSAYSYTPWPKPSGINSNLTMKQVRIPNIFRNVTRYKIESPSYRNKIIVKPDVVEKQTVHRAWKYLSTQREVNIPPDEALVYHFRDEPYSKPDKNVKTVSPFSATSKDKITESIFKVVQEILEQYGYGLPK